MSLEYRKWLTFSTFVLIAGLLWFFFKYKEVYTQHVAVDVLWVNVPSNVKLKDGLSYQLDVELTGNGFNLLKASYVAPIVELDFQKYVYKNGDYFFDPKSVMGSLKTQLANNYKIGYVSEELITIKVDEFISKKVGLRSKIKTVYEDNYLPVVSPYFIPDSVVITGNDLLIKDLDILEVSHTDIAIKDTLVIKHIDLVELYPDIKVEPSNVDYVIKSAVMTEGAFMVPVDVINNKDNVAVKIIPSEVEVVFNCKLQEYEMIDVSDFKAVVDYNDLSEDYNLITTEVKILSDKVSSIRFSPQQIQILVMR
ncbi:YbbR-like domain-containing protein [Nonlabens ulvanivorans]|uniref:hypothetical protein n=1 Tax=Nonlabens ulvanivorans TaxID=906888 RepID=UPI002943BA8F|nr:hypothetical protein [Nonlabens ulvanivorans]WOI24132.1 hypothetical protein R1T42_06690 [Nonlabens ulvanivorans]